MEKYFAWFGLKGALVLTTLLSSLALMLAIAYPSPARWLCFAAMLMSSVGDIFLMHFKIIEEKIKNYFLVGAVFFMLAHLLYAACFTVKILNASYAYWNGGAMIAVLIEIFCLILFSLISKNREHLPLVVIYLSLIMFSCMSVFSYAWSAQSAAAVIASVGAASFLASDEVIGFGMLADIHRWDDLIWWLYPIGQALLILGVGR